MKTIQVKAKPGSKRSGLELGKDGIWIARIKSPPVDGKANAELIELVAEHFGCRKSNVTIRSGAGGRMKLVNINQGN